MKQQKLERCGFCGSYFRGNEYVDADELNKLTKKELNNAPMGYCPNANYEAEQDQEPQRRVTRDMAIDAGMPELEGQLI